MVIALFCGFLGIMSIGYLVLPGEDFSALEKRYLAEAPRMNLSDLASGKWGEDMESYMADHIPGRDFFVGLNAYFELITGRQSAKDIRLYDGYLLEAPKASDPAVIESNMQIINQFAEAVQAPVDLMIVPSAGWVWGRAEYSDREIIEEIYGMAGEHVAAVDLRTEFQGKPEYYYKTDHHWTALGAYHGYSEYLEHLEIEKKFENTFEKEQVEGFHGSTYSRSGLWNIPAETLELWHGSDAVTVMNDETSTVHDGVFYRERLEEPDKYTVYLDGNHSVVRILNPNQKGKLLVIRDSYSNCLGCFLGESFGEVVLVDLRYYKRPVTDLAANENFDHILVCYSLGNFLSDKNIVLLR